LNDILPDLKQAVKDGAEEGSESGTESGSKQGIRDGKFYMDFPSVDVPSIPTDMPSCPL